MGESLEYKTRDELPPQLRAISDTLDEWLARAHGIISSWQNPEWFLQWLEGRGWTVVEKTQIGIRALSAGFWVDERITPIDGRRPLNITLGDWEELSPQERDERIFGKRPVE